MAKVCIICEKEPMGKAYQVRDDAIIKAIRAVKQRFGIAKNNELCVDEGCFQTYLEKRKKFERNFVFYVAVGVIIFVLINGLQLLYGKFSIVTFLASVLLAVVVAALAVLNYATPPIEDRGTMQAPAAHLKEEKEHAKHMHSKEAELASRRAKGAAKNTKEKIRDAGRK